MRLLIVILFLLTAMVPPATATDTPLLLRGLGPEPDSLDIHLAQGLSSINLLRDLREGLVSHDAAGELVPGVARRWSRSEDGLQWTFELDPAARWSDGSRVTAEDFIRAWQRALDPLTASPTAALLAPLVSAGDAGPQGDQPDEQSDDPDRDTIAATVTADGSLQIRLHRPVPWLPELLTHPVTFPLPPGDYDDPRTAAVNGAYQLAGWSPGSHVDLAINPHYRLAGSVRLPRVRYLTLPDPNAELARYRAGELHITETIPPHRFDWLRENIPEEMFVTPYLGSFFLGLNLRRPPLAGNAALRRALALAIDRRILAERVLNAGEVVAYGLVPPGMAGYQPQELVEATADQATRQAEAQRLYRAAGYGPERPLELELRHNTSTSHRRTAVAVAAMWRQVLGVNTRLINEEWKVFVNNRRLGRLTQVFRGGWIADFADPINFLDLFRSDSALNWTFYDDPDYDALLARAAQATGDERLRRLQRAEAHLLERLPIIPLYYYVSRHLVKTEVEGFVANLRDVHLSRHLDLVAR